MRMEKRHIADAHTHIFPEKIAEKATINIGKFYGLHMGDIGTAEYLVETGSKAGVTRYLVCSVATKESQVKAINDFIYAACQVHPEFVGFASLHPDFTEIESEIERVYGLGMRGIKFHPDFQVCNIDDEKLIPTYRKMAELGLPGLFHMGDNRYDYSAPARLRKVKEKIPELICIAAHFGGYRRWDEAYRELGEVDGLYFDTSSSLFALSSDVAVDMIRHFGADRFMFGTDFPMWTYADELERFNALPLTEDERQQIFAGTFEELFGVKV